jgi:hypothetical protein
LTFLSSVNIRGGFIQPHGAALDVTAWELPRGDPLISPSLCAFQPLISNLVRVIKAEPPSSWSLGIFRAETLAIQCDEEGNISPGSVSPDDTVLLKLFEETLGAVEAPPSPVK